MKDIIIAFLLLVSINGFGQSNRIAITPESNPELLGYPIYTIPQPSIDGMAIKLSADSLPMTIEWPFTREKSTPQFIRVDTTKGIVIFPSKSNLCVRAYKAIKIDSVWQYTGTREIGCPEGRIGCLVYHCSTETVEERKTIAIDCIIGEIDLSKNYTFIPESEILK